MRSINLGTQVRRICYPCCRHLVSEFRVHFWLFFASFLLSAILIHTGRR